MSKAIPCKICGGNRIWMTCVCKVYQPSDQADSHKLVGPGYKCECNCERCQSERTRIGTCALAH